MASESSGHIKPGRLLKTTQSGVPVAATIPQAAVEPVISVEYQEDA